MTLAQRYGKTNGRNGDLHHREMRGIAFLERAGDGPALVFLHGIGSSSDSFIPLFETFPDGPRLIAWNAPGYLTSKPLAAARPTAMDYADVLERFLDNLGIRVVTIIGHSLGTLIAAAFASRVPERVSSVVLAASAQGYGVGENEDLPTKAVDRLRDLQAQGPKAFAQARAPRLVFEPDANPAVVGRVRQEMERINPDGYRQAVHMLASGNLAASVAQLHNEPSFIIGAEDRITPMAQTRAAMQAWAAVHGKTPRCISIEGAGHAVYVQEPQAFCEALLELVPQARTPMQSYSEGELHGG